MAVSFQPVEPERQSEIQSFLCTTFRVEDDRPAFRPDVLAWKFFERHPWWPDGRSYVVEKDGAIAAHGCVAPLRFSSNGHIVESMEVIDWAANKVMPGAGLAIFKKCLAMGQTLLAVGGSEDTQQLIPTLNWFARRAELRWYALPLRPFGLAQHATKKNLRTVAKLLRNVGWQNSRSQLSSDGWSCSPTTDHDAVCSGCSEAISILRTGDWFRYLFRYPATKLEMLRLEKNGVPCGHAVLAVAFRQCRLVDFVPQSAGAREQAAALAAVIQYAKQNTAAVEFVAASSLAAYWEAFERCGLRRRYSAPVYIADPGKLISPDQPLEINMLLGDAFYVHDPEFPFLL